MNDGFLNAECVFAYLMGIGFIKKENWKHETKELYYPVRFYITSSHGSLSFEIVTIERLHCVTKSSMRCLSKRHGINLDTVFAQCLI
jgi:hypothetical protein